jgi:hypothetical protein
MQVERELRNQIINYARQLADERGWPWLEPVDIISASEGGEAAWLIRTNILNRGQNIRITLRRSDLTPISCGFLPR